MKQRMKKVQALLIILCVLAALNVVGCWKIRQTEKPYRLAQVLNGETIKLTTGKVVKLLGVNTTMNSENAQMAKIYLNELLSGKNLWLEYDRSGKDSLGNDQVWIWVGCERMPKFLLNDLAIRIKQKTNQDSPIGCKQGALVSEQIIAMGWSKVHLVDGVQLKYSERLFAKQK